MNDELFLCKYWNQNTVPFDDKISVRVSDFIYGNENKTLCQIHVLLMYGDDVAYLKQISGGSLKLLELLENMLRQSLRVAIHWQEDLDNSTIKIWYFNQNDRGEIESGLNHNDPQVRFAITMNHVEPLQEHEEKTVLHNLVDIIIEWLDRL